MLVLTVSVLVWLLRAVVKSLLVVVLKVVKDSPLNIGYIIITGESKIELNARFTLRKAYRLLNSSDYSNVFDNTSIKSSHPQFLILAKPNCHGHPRLGLIIAKKNVRLSVKRNRLKRLIRETFRTKQHNLPPIDAIVLARRGTENLNNIELTEILYKLWTRVAKKATKQK